MEVDDIPQIESNVDYNLIQPINQKRTIVFVNHFLLSTTSFLNNFAASCESRLMHFEYKLQKVEASLLILESQLSSIPDLNNITCEPIEVAVDLPEIETQNSDENVKIQENGNNEEDVDKSDLNQEENGELKACKDPRFSKFFKMLQFGVPAQAVKLKMDLEGIDSSILDNPNAVIPG